MLRALVPAGQGRRGHAVDGRHVHDPPSSCRPHVRDRHAGESDRSDRHGLEGLPSLLVSDLLDRAGDLRSRVVHEPEWPQVLDHALAGFRVCDVEEYRVHVHAGLLGLGVHVPRLLLGADAPDGVKPSSGQLLHGCQSDPRVRAGHEDGIAHQNSTYPDAPRVKHASDDSDAIRVVPVL